MSDASIECRMEKHKLLDIRPVISDLPSLPNPKNDVILTRLNIVAPYQINIQTFVSGGKCSRLSKLHLPSHNRPHTGILQF